MIDRIKTRLSSDEGFTLIELLVVIVILGILVAIAVPSYLSLRGNAQDAAAKSNVRSAIPAAEEYYQTTGNFSYTGMTQGTLNATAPGIAPNVLVSVSHDGDAYCLEDTEASGHSAYYIGGDQNLLESDGVTHDGNGFAGPITGVVSSVTGDNNTADDGAVCAAMGAGDGT
jgi:type IV pilus assembly protein PilA